MTPNVNTPIDMRLFTWLPEHRELVADISDLGKGDPFQRLYDDACDIGFSIRSHHTGRVVVYALHRVKKDCEGDVLCWTFKPIPTRGAPDVNVCLFND